MNKIIVLKTERLQLRTWHEEDITELTAINSDPEVMKFFPSTQSKEQSIAFIKRMQNQFEERKHCYFAAETIDNQSFIGFIGLAYQTYEADFTPGVDIGWRLNRKSWGKGYATEGAKACLDYGFNVLGLNSIFSVCPRINVNSEKVMQKIGMVKSGSFKHPKLNKFPIIEDCLLYQAKNPTY